MFARPSRPTIVAATCIAALTPTFASAQDHVFTPLPAPAERPYPYEIIGIQPGDNLADVTAILTARSDTPPTGDREVMSVQAPDGRSLQFTYERNRVIGGLTLNERLAEADHDSLGVILSSTVLEQRPMSVGRSMRKPTAELPTAQALQAQMEETYGPPSAIETSTGNVTLTYAWSDEGFITDMAAQPTRDITFTENNGREVTVKYQPCMPQRNGAYSGDIVYNFRYPRTGGFQIMPGCVAMFTISHSVRPGTTTISFNLTDYDLARQNRDELDRQIIEALTGDKTPVKPSKIEL